ncbi:glutenin, high molecular weight subunit PW212-like isoform X2 [Mercurialis annua]|uniref:glutenin, high molecular weight subunit PW212-like isoform X2 n=1 Tax=Mercurialis annua TaxID=3986 RepID=UPI00215F766C|nr:glutenin, high molecular weight subunit PW212-like isoform X2 [Mercurialis annua]
MGFDNDCILNIQSLAGEYFCPVCRFLVYPNEALQSQCTHLYCKPCLTYVVSTTRACPYDGYLVTETDSKPLIESNKPLAETIGKITVHCLYHRSGCSWQGPLSECTTHCSECAFGNSPVVCNRCGVQTMHRQVQEHAQNCPGVQPLAHAEGAQDASVATATSAGNHSQPATQAEATTIQAQASETTKLSVPGQDCNQQANATTQSQAAPQAAVPTAEQWYQQQQQYQQYYQQYPGYDPYQQQYQQHYPYQQNAVPQYAQAQANLQSQQQVQPHPQLQTQAQSHPQMQLPAAAQPQSQPQTQTTAQPQLHTNLAPHGHPPPQAQLHQQTRPVQHHTQHGQYQQLHSQVQAQVDAHSQHNTLQSQLPAQGLPQTHAQNPTQPTQQPLPSQPSQPLNPQLQPQPHHSFDHAVTGHHFYPQPQPQNQMSMGGLHNAMHYPQGGPQPQLPQQSPLVRAPQSHVPIQNPQQSSFLPSSSQVPNVSPAQPQPVHAQQPVMESVQQPIHPQYVQQQQQPFPGQSQGPVQNQVSQQGAYVPQLHGQTHLHPQGPHSYPQPMQNVALQHGIQPHQTQNLGGRPMLPPYGGPAHTHPHSSVGMQIRPMHVDADQHSGNALRTNNQPQFPSQQHSGPASRQICERQDDHMTEKGSGAVLRSQENVRRDPNKWDVVSGHGVDAGEMRTGKYESNLKLEDEGKKSINDAKDVSKSLSGENMLTNVKEEPKEGTDDQKGASNTEYDHNGKDKRMKDGTLIKSRVPPEGEHLEGQDMESQGRNATQYSGGFPMHGQVQGEGLVQPSHGPSALQQRSVGSLLSPAPPLGSLHQMQLPGHPSSALRPLGPGHMIHGPEVLPAGIASLGSTPASGRGESHYGPHGTYIQSHSLPSQGEMFPNQRPSLSHGRRLDSIKQQPGMHSNAVRMNGAPGMNSSLAHGMRDDRRRTLLDEHMNSFPLDPTRRIVDRREFEDHKHLSRPSDLDAQFTNKFESNFPSRLLDRGPLDKGLYGSKYDSGMKSEALGGPAPSRFFPPYHHDTMMHPNDIAERPIVFHDNAVGRQPDAVRPHPEFFGPISGYDRRHRDNMGSRSPGRDYYGISSHGFGVASRPDDFNGRESRRLGDSFLDNRFPDLPSHLRVDEFGQDGFSNDFRREHLGHHNLRNRLGESIRFGGFPGASGMGELFRAGDFFHPRLGEPGFRSRFSSKGFHGDGGNYTVKCSHCSLLRSFR